MTAPETDVNLAVSRVVKVLLAHRRETQAQLSLATGLRKATLIRRMAGDRSWTAPEIAVLAKHFEVPVGVFYAGPDALLRSGAGTVTHESQSARRPAGPAAHPLNPAALRSSRGLVPRPRTAADRTCPGTSQAA